MKGVSQSDLGVSKWDEVHLVALFKHSRQYFEQKFFVVLGSSFTELFEVQNILKY